MLRIDENGAIRFVDFNKLGDMEYVAEPASKVGVPVQNCNDRARGIPLSIWWCDAEQDVFPTGISHQCRL